MKALFESGTLYDLIALGMAVEALALAVYNRRTGLGIPPAAFLLNLAAGLNLVLALVDRAEERWWGLIALHLTLALVCHAMDLRRLWRR